MVNSKDATGRASPETRPASTYLPADAPPPSSAPSAARVTDSAPARPPRCAHLFPGLTGCREPAEPGSRYCAGHGGA
jgi:hypothetical protein